ncbi:uncharacterized protein PV09_03963 [Verruconis gallopava]|uniref:DUF8004 domain-containing protein n=1 Tax=Verruconis gallopava TaxID=253628 RepID=A0A0D2ACX8_9PEZI|nr:uncharacterized protein PV09_03963 [Verruconis gallopava]KIW04773.1 hypothetical protein PV09_03963 [Verruconis gallopava]
MATLQKKKEERRAVSHNPQTLPERPVTPNHTLWTPPQQQQHGRSSSVQIPKHKLLSPLAPPIDLHRKPVGSSESATSPRVSSATTSPVNSRPNTSYSSQPASPFRSTLAPHHANTLPVPTSGESPGHSPGSSPTRASKRKSWFLGGEKKLTKPSKDFKEEKQTSWIAGIDGQKPAYDLRPLLNAQQVSELWDPQGDVFVYLFPRTSGKGPSFRVDSGIFSSSSVLTKLAFGNIYSVAGAGMSTTSLSHASQRQSSMDRTPRPGSRTASPAPIFRSPANSTSDPSEDSLDSRGLDEVNSGPIHLYLPISLSADGAITGPGDQQPSLSENDIDILVSVRNLFAFLQGQSIVATERRSSIFGIFLKVADLLNSFGFSNLDGSTFGEVANASFNSYVEELRISDVRHSREKTIEAIVLGERMRSVLLYNEAFVHGVGKWDDLLELKSPKFELISDVTKMRMERAALDLQSRKRNINQKLHDFEFPGMFAGIMNSKTADEAKTVRFNVWRDSFMSTRKWFMGYYKNKYGSWPPKASSKKNNLETSGLNRLVLRDLYQDLSDLYDLLVDRTALTTRTTDMVMEDDDTEESWGPMHRALRKVLNEYDRSTPPVQPPIPFDTPRIPAMTPVGDKKAELKARAKKLKKDQLYKVLKDSYNPDTDAKQTPFLTAFKEYEFSQAVHCTIGHVADLRQGQWLFMYGVLQSLPLLVVDAPAVKWTEGVEYFLCMPPRSGVPWALAERERKYYAVAGNANTVVSLPSDVIEFGIEGIYRRSHCWIMAEKWTANSEIMQQAVAETLQRANDALPALPGSIPAADSTGSRSRSQSPNRPDRMKRASVILSGLEALPMPPSVFANGIGSGVRTPSGSGSPILGPKGSPTVRPSSQADSSKTFDAILGSMEAAGGAAHSKKGKKK